MEDKKMNNLAYFAGIMDGDGSFSLCKKIEKEGNSPLYYPLIQLSTTNFCLIDMLQKTFGGAVNTRAAYNDKNNISHKTSQRWSLQKRNKCLPFLIEIVDFLSVKKERAQFLIDFINNNPFKRGSNKIFDEIIKNRDVAYIKMQSFNKGIQSLFFKFPVRRKTTDDTIFWNYAAGLMDTDGSFCLKRERSYYSPVISLSMIDHRALYRLIKNCEWGNICHVKANTSRNLHSYRYNICSLDEAIKFLERIIPYLRLKTEQAKILYDFCLKKKEANKLTQEQNEFYYKKIIEINNGVYKPSLIVLKTLTDNAEGNKEQAGDKPCSLNAVSEKGLENKVCGTLTFMET